MPGIPHQALFAGVAFALLAANPAPATIVPRLDLPDLARSAELIVHGRVLRHWSDWDQAHQFIWTHYLLEVTELLKGAPTRTVTVSEPGGAVGGTRMKISAATEYSDGEEVIVFLQRTPIGYWRCYGWGQGKYTVAHSADGRTRVRTNLAGLVFIDRPGSAARGRPGTLSPLGRLDGMEVSDFKRFVRKEAE